jgi:hypothetical protein
MYSDQKEFRKKKSTAPRSSARSGFARAPRAHKTHKEWDRAPHRKFLHLDLKEAKALLDELHA